MFQKGLYRHILRFYSSFALATVLITLACCKLYHYWGASILPMLFFFKILTNAIVWYLVKEVSEKKLYYYYNLHISKAKLWLPAFIFDMLILILLLSLITPLPQRL